MERRRTQRVKISVLGRYMLADRREFPCQTLDMSPGGLALFAPVRGEIGERVVVYLDQLGRVEGTIARHMETGFAIAMTLPLIKREKIADKLTWLANRTALGLPEDRRHERIEPVHKRTTLKTVEGHEYPARLIDVSASGAALTSTAKFPVGTGVTIGRTPGTVVRVGTDTWRAMRCLPDSPVPLRWLCIRGGGDTLANIGNDADLNQERPFPWAE